MLTLIAIAILHYLPPQASPFSALINTPPSRHAVERILFLLPVIGATFIPFLAIALLILNGRADWVGERFRNRPATVVVLVATLAFFAWIGWRSLMPG